MEIAPTPSKVAGLNDQSRMPSRPDETAEAARQFEAMLLRQFIQEAFKPLFEESGSGGGPGKDVYQYLMTDVLADSLSQSQAFGFSNLIQMQLAGSGEKPTRESPNFNSSSDEYNRT